MEYCSATDKKETPPFVTRIDLEGVMLSEIISQRKTRYDLTYMSKKPKPNKAGTQRNREQSDPHQGLEAGGCWEILVKTCKLPAPVLTSPGEVMFTV